MAFRDYFLDPDLNTTIGEGIYIGANMARDDVRPALQQLAADGKDLNDKILPTGSLAGKFLAFDGSGNPVAASGTGTDEGLRTDLAAATGSQLLGLGNGSSLADIIRVNAAEYGFRPSQTAAQNLTALTDAITANDGGANPVVIDIPPATYAMDLLSIDAANIWINAHGSTFTEGARISVGPTATNFRLKGARFYVDTAQSILTINADNSIVDDVWLEKFGTGDGYMMMTEGTEQMRFQGITFRGGNGFFIESQRVLIADIHGVGRAAGGDDFLVIKARNQRSGDIRIASVYAENYSNGLAFGSEIGTLGGGVSATRPGRVENVLFDLLCKNCSYGVFIKPGAIDNPATPAAYDWEDGLVAGIKGSVKIGDPSGTKLARGLVISPARNALVDDFDIEIQGEGRFSATADTECWAHVFFPDSTAYTAGGTGPGGIIGNGRIKVRGKDIYAGVDNSGPTPGNPPLYGLLVEKQNAAVGALSGTLRVDAYIDGTKAAGIYVANTNGVILERLIGRSLTNNPGTSLGGITADNCTIRAPGENDVQMANTTYKPVHLIGTGDVVGKRLTVDFDSPAGAALTQTRFRQLPHAAWLRKVSGVPKDTVGVGGTDYFTIELRALAGLQYDGTALDSNALTTFGTNVTATTAITPFNFPAMPANIGAGTAFDDRFLSADATLRFLKTNGGAGQPYVGPVDLHYVQLGPTA
jgi:hypothetical protein